ncbi:MAG: bifunctional riboflavin kinase/FAD synthetase [Clostridia bacterium]|nr:bifunctional riboflavin kinase/FAD synthetase [Clostridia bacterium]
MEILHALPDISYNKPSVIALGNFDGVHRGHQVLISRTVQKAKKIGGKSVVLTFNPHPLTLIRPEESPKLLITQQQKEAKIAELGADLLLFLPFTPEFAALSPDEFIAMIHRVLRPASVVIGFNYTYGYRGSGNADTLRNAGKKLGFEVEVVPPQKIGGELISSTKIRQALAEGDIKGARELLGYWPILAGKVGPGAQRGRELGFPTANVAIPEEIMLPRLGVYGAKCIIEERSYLSVVNIGIKPTFDQENKPVVEAHILDFQGDLYGRLVELHLFQYLRPEKRFPCADELMKQIAQDILVARSGSMYL